MLAQLDYRLPSGRLWRYEPKLDGFRGLLWHRSAGQAQLLSRNARDLGQWFRELTRAARALPPDTLIDGEIVICDDSGWVDFGSLQARLGQRGRLWRPGHSTGQRFLWSLTCYGLQVSRG